VMGEEGLVKVIESFGEEVVEAIDRRVFCAGRRRRRRSSSHDDDERLEVEKGSVVEGKLMEIDRFI